MISSRGQPKTRNSEKLTTDDCHRIDVREMSRDGSLTVGAKNKLSGETSNEEIRLTADAGQVRVQHGIRLLAGFRTLNHQVIKLGRTRCNYGGARVWFRCPECESRAAVLYRPKRTRGKRAVSAKDRTFKCRRCHNLVYPSQREDWESRMLRKAHKMWIRVGGQNSDKPKGMHWRTYNRLVSEAQHFTELWYYGPDSES